MANKLPIVNYSGKQKEIASGDKIPYDYIEGNNTVIEIPSTAFSDVDNPTLSEVQTWVDSNLTIEQLYNSTIVYVRDIILKPEEYSFPTSSRSLTISGSDQATLDNVIINGNSYGIAIPMQDASGFPLTDADLYSLHDAIYQAFISEGVAIELMILYTNITCIIKFWQTSYNSSSPAVTFACTYTNNSSTTTTSTVTNTASIISGEITDIYSPENPFAVYRVINSKVYQINIKERTSFYEINVRNLPTHNPVLHPYGLIATEDKRNLSYISTKEGWVLLNNTNFGGSTTYPHVEFSNAVSYTNSPIYAKITLNSLTSANYSSYLQQYIRITKLEPTVYFEIVDYSTTPYVEINGKLEETNSAWIQSTVETTRIIYRNVYGGTAKSYPLYVRLLNTDSASGNANLTISALLHNGIYLQTGSIIGNSPSFTIPISSDSSIRLIEESTNVNKNIHLPHYTDTELSTISLNSTTDVGKTIWNTTQSEVQVWDGTAWNALGTGGGGGANLTFTGASSPYTLASDSGTDVTFSAGSNITLTRTGNDLEIAATGGGTTNLTFSGSGPFTLESSTGSDVTFTEGDSIDITRTGNDLTVAATGVVKTTTDQTVLGIKTFGTSAITQVFGGGVYVEDASSNATDISGNYVGLFNTGSGQSSFTATSSKIINRDGYSVGASDLLRKDEIETLISASGGSPEYDAAVSASSSGTITLNRSEELFLTTSLTNAHSFTVALNTQTTGKVNEYILIFKIGATVPTITQPGGIVWRGSTPYFAANQTWTIVYEYVQVSSTPTWEIYGTAIKNV